MKRIAWTFLMVWLVAGGILPLPCEAQPMAEHVPGDALLVIAWQGAEPLGEALAGSGLDRVTEAIRQHGELGEAWRTALREMEAIWPDERVATLNSVAEAAATMSDVLWNRPWALSVHGPDAHAALRMRWLCDPGEEREDVAARLRALVERLRVEVGGPVFGSVQVVTVDGMVGIAFGQLDEGQAPLSERPAFQAMMAVAAFEPALMVYIDSPAVERILQTAVLPVGAKMPPWLGHSGRQLYLGRPDDDAWQWRWMYEAPRPREGLLALLDDDRPVDEALISRVPRDAPWFQVSAIDLAQFVQIARQSGVEGDADWLFMLARAADVDLERDLLDALGDQWLSYADPAAGGALMGLCVINPLRRPGDAERALRRLTTEPLPPDHAQPRFVRERHGDLELYRLDLTGHGWGQPSWAIIDGHLYLARSPQTIIHAHRHLVDRRPSMLDHPDYQRLRRRLGDQPAWQLHFDDLPRSARAASHTHRFLAYMVAFALAADGIELSPARLLPPPDLVTPHLGPAAGLVWVDEHGVHGRSFSPFPGSTAMSERSFVTGVGLTAIAEGMLPLMEASSRTARSQQALTAARGVFLAQVQWRQRHPDQSSRDVAALHESGLRSVASMISPFTAIDVPDDLDQWPAEQRRAWIREHASFVLLRDDPFDFRDVTIAIVMRPDHGKGGVPVVYSDDTVRWEHDLDALDRALQEQTGLTLQQLISRQIDAAGNPAGGDTETEGRP